MFEYTTLCPDTPPTPGRAIDLWLPRIVSRPVALCLIHGGGWRQGHREQMQPLMSAFLAEGYPCLSADYRTAAGTTAFTQLADLRTLLALGYRTLEKAGFTGPLVLYGSSAGGHLALLAGLAAPGACGEPSSSPSPPLAGVVACCAPVVFEPWPEIFPGSWASMQDAAGAPYEDAPERYRLLSPQTHAGPGSPPLCFLLGECEHMFPNALTEALARRLRSQGVAVECHTYPMAEHGFFYSLERPCQKAAFADMLGFLNRVSGAV